MGKKDYYAMMVVVVVAMRVSCSNGNYSNFNPRPWIHLHPVSSPTDKRCDETRGLTRDGNEAECIFQRGWPLLLLLLLLKSLLDTYSGKYKTDRSKIQITNILFAVVFICGWGYIGNLLLLMFVVYCHWILSLCPGPGPDTGHESNI